LTNELVVCDYGIEEVQRIKNIGTTV